VSVIYLLPSYNKHEKFDKILLKAVILSLAATISGQGNTSIAKTSDADSQVVIRG